MDAEQDFRRAAAGELPCETLDYDGAVACALDGDFRIVYCNRAWDEFAIANGGEAVTRERVIGRPLFDFIASPLDRFYRTALANAAAERRPWEQTYECSSPESFRQYRMRALPLHASPYMVVLHSLIVERPHDASVRAPLPGMYRDAGGLIVMCSHCRRTRRAARPEIWDWVPAFVASLPEWVSHGLCRACAAYYYPEFMAG